jgi:molecular chaperone GrpE
MTDTFTTGEPHEGHGGHGGPGTDGGSEPPVVRDRRRIDPQTGEVRGGSEGVPVTPSQPTTQADDTQLGTEAQAEAESETATENEMAAELLADLQRLQAEYVNYRKRVERDRDLVRDLAVAGVLEALMPVLDDVQLAREHGDLDTGPFAAIADKLEAALGKFGLQRFGAVGEPFDPAVHEALMHTHGELDEGVDVTTVTQVMQPGYKAGERLLRAARVAVADPQ